MKKGLDYPGITVVYFCHDGQGNVVMSKRGINCRDEYGCWDIGGGGLEFGHTIEETLRKEIKEEYCTDVTNYEFLGYRDVHRKHGDDQTHWIALDFKVLVDKEKIDNGEPHKFDAVEWFKLSKLPQPQHSQLSKFLELYKNVL